uniref:Kazal-like domain-containing protein n=1 Tax=Glossina morsitans morsitans TaxID=37546 RepID=A0A1B0FIH6_GLOMM
MKLTNLMMLVVTVVFVIFGIQLNAVAALCPCPRIYDPVCADNMITYGNRCEFECSNTEMKRSGRHLRVLRWGQC